MALTHAEPRLAPLGSPFFQVSGPQPRALKRSHSYSGYAPHRLWLSLDDLQGRRSGGFRAPSPGTAACAALASDDGSTSAPGSGASESPSSPGKFSSEATTQADSFDEESSPELWPDTDSDGEESYEWSPCSRRRAVALAPAEAGSRGEGTCWASPQIFATIPAASAACYPEAVASQCAPAAHLAPLPSYGHAGWAGAPPSAAAPRGAVGLPLARAPPQAPAPPMPPALLPVTAMAPGGLDWFGSQRPPAARGALTDAAATAPGGAGSLQCAMQAAESALVALEAAEAEAAEDAEAVSAGRARPAQQSRQSSKPLPQGVTSLMVRSLPREVSQRDLLDEIHRSSFAGRVDFCYMPRDFASGQNRGHAFLNFTSHEAATEFHRVWHGRPTCAGRPATGATGVDISVAALQGLAANMAKWDSPRTRRVRNPDYKPFVLDGGSTRAASRR